MLAVAGPSLHQEARKEKGYRKAYPRERIAEGVTQKAYPFRIRVTVREKCDHIMGKDKRYHPGTKNEYV